MVRFLIPLLALTFLSACIKDDEVKPVDPGCNTYRITRSSIPRPIPDNALGRWVAFNDAGMTAACLN